MKIAFHLATPPAPRPELDAAVQEIESLRSAFGGELTSLYPGSVYRPWIRRRRLGRRQTQAWLELDRRVDLHHVVSDRPLDYAVLRRLERPVVYRLLTPTNDLSKLTRLASYGPIVVSAPAEAERLRRDYGLTVEAIAPGIDTERFATVGPPPEGPFTVLFASAPWTRRHFATKGLDALLGALARRPEMRLILLGRGVLGAQTRRRLHQARLESRTEFIDTTVRPEDVLRRAHVTVLAPSSSRVVKTFPHSLLEALAAGRPVLTSDRLAIADWVLAHGCGEVVDPGTEALGRGLDRLAADYARYREAVARLDMSTFSAARCRAAYGRLYDRTLRDGG